MRSVLVCGLLVALLGSVFAISGGAAKPAAKNPNLGKLRHVVLFRFKEGTSAEQIKAIEEAFRALPSKIPTIVDYEWGTDVSVENLSDGFTHCFVVTFNDAEGRKVYLPHPAHKALVDMVGPHLDKPMVVDYVAKP